MPNAFDLVPVDECPDCCTVHFEGRCRGCGYVAPPIPHVERPTDGDELAAQARGERAPSCSRDRAVP